MTELAAPAIEPPVTPAPVQHPATEPTSPAPAEHMIPKSRFDEVNGAKEKAEKELKKFQDAEEAKRLAALDETQREKEKAATAERERDEARAEAQSVRIETAVLLDASKAQFGAKNDQRFSNAELAYKLIGVEGLAVTVENGKVIGHIDALKALAKKYPELLESTTNQSRVVTPSQPQARPNTTNNQPTARNTGTRY